MTLVNTPTATVIFPGLDDLTFTPDSVEITLDEGHAPYVRAVIVIAMPTDAAVLASLDPRDDLRVTIATANTWEATARPDEARTFDLYLHKRTARHEASLVELIAHSDEALLIDGGNVDDEADTSARAFDDSLRDIIDSRLAAHGASLEAGADDADYTLVTTGTNLARNPRGVTGSAGNPTDWASTIITGTRTISQPGSGGPETDCPSFVRATATSTLGAGYLAYLLESTIPVDATKKYSASVWVRVTTAMTIALTIRTYDAGSVLIHQVGTGPVAVAANTWTRLDYDMLVTASGVKLRPSVSLGSNLPNGGTFDVTGWRVSETSGIHDGDYFDGAKTADTHYTYGWTGTAHLSTSMRIPQPTWPENQVLDQDPGTTDWDFLHPLVSAAGLRLFCDEERNWRLVGNDYTVAGTIDLDSSVDVKRADDEISLEGDYGTAVVIRYHFTIDGSERERFDVAGSGGPILFEDLDQFWPGPGAAAAKLERALTRARSIPLAALLNLDATPGMATAIALPATADQVGTISAVTFSIGAGTSETEVTARDLADA